MQPPTSGGNHMIPYTLESHDPPPHLGTTPVSVKYMPMHHAKEKVRRVLGDLGTTHIIAIPAIRGGKVGEPHDPLISFRNHMISLYHTTPTHTHSHTCECQIHAQTPSHAREKVGSSYIRKEADVGLRHCKDCVFCGHSEWAMH